jgi:NADPH:quinone reductase-like Zn-dependent oxidoreductase
LLLGLWRLLSGSLGFMMDVMRILCYRSSKGLYSKYGSQSQTSWALVTGASEGIGFAFCQILAERGFNIIMIARN